MTDERLENFPLMADKIQVRSTDKEDTSHSAPKMGVIQSTMNVVFHFHYIE